MKGKRYRNVCFEGGGVVTKTLGPARRNARGRIKVQYSTAKDVLEKLKAMHPLPGMWIENEGETI